MFNAIEGAAVLVLGGQVRVEVKSVNSMPLDVCAWLVQRDDIWVLYITEQVLDSLGGNIPGVGPHQIVPRRVTPEQ